MKLLRSKVTRTVSSTFLGKNESKEILFVESYISSIGEYRNVFRQFETSYEEPSVNIAFAIDEHSRRPIGEAETRQVRSGTDRRRPLPR